MNISDVLEHGASISKGLVSTVKLSALIRDERLSSILHEIEKWCLFFDLHVETLKGLPDTSVEIPIYLLGSLRDAVSKTQHLRHDALKATLNNIVFTASDDIPDSEQAIKLNIPFRAQG